MLIVVEGCDGSGKSTLVNKLAAEHKAEVIHFGAEIARDRSGFDTFVKVIMDGQHKNIIVDRFCYGQFVYQESYERMLTSRHLLALDALLNATGAMVILVEAPAEVIKQRLRARHEKVPAKAAPRLTVEAILFRFHALLTVRRLTNFRIVKGV